MSSGNSSKKINISSKRREGKQKIQKAGNKF